MSTLTKVVRLYTEKHSFFSLKRGVKLAYCQLVSNTWEHFGLSRSITLQTPTLQLRTQIFSTHFRFLFSLIETKYKKKVSVRVLKSIAVGGGSFQQDGNV